MHSRRDGRWTPLSRDQGVILCGGDNRAWQALRVALLEMGIIECDGAYEIEVKCYDYRLPAPWEERDISRYTPSDHGVTARLAEIYRRNRERSTKTRPPVAEFLEGGLRRLRLHEAEADRVIASIGEPERRRCASLVAMIIQHGGQWDRTVEFCDYGRAHSIVTRTPRELRAAFRIDGEPLVEVDVRNCQPLLLGMMAAECAMRRRTTSERRLTKRRGGEGRKKGGGRGRSSIPYGSADLHACMLPSDLAEYVRVCASGCFYEELASTLGLPCSCPVERERIKPVAMWLLNGDLPPRLPYWLAFAARWPTAASYLDELKRADHRGAAHALQRAESDMMIRGVCAELMVRHPEMPLLAIHDALLVPQYGVGPVVEAIGHVWSRAGASPTLKLPKSA